MTMIALYTDDDQCHDDDNRIAHIIIIMMNAWCIYNDDCILHR